MMQQHVTGASPELDTSAPPTRRTETYRAPAVHLQHRLMKPLENPREEIWRLNLIQYYRGWIQHRPTPRGVTLNRAHTIKRRVYDHIPDRLKPKHLRRA